MKIALHISNQHECGYFDDRIATTLFVDPSEKMTSGTYDGLLKNGFRRSGHLIYKPYCKNCNACVPLRISSHEFKPSRSQQRVLNKNSDITYRVMAPQYLDEHYRLYKTYLTARHGNGGMEKHTEMDYRESMLNSGVNSALIEYRINKKPVCVSVTDMVDDGLSAVYNYFDPYLSKQRSLGIFAILSQIYLARSLHRSWLYLGYWIADSRKMAYKSSFSASEILENGDWNRL